MDTTNGRGFRVVTSYPGRPAGADAEVPAAPLTSEADARAAVRSVSDYVTDRLAGGPPWSDPDFADPLWIDRAPG